MATINFGEDFATQKAYSRDGIFTRFGEIVRASVGYNIPVREGWSPSDILLKVELSQEGLSWNKEITVWGDFGRDGEGTINSEGSAFRVLDLLRALRQNGSIKVPVSVTELGRVAFDGKAAVGTIDNPWCPVKELEGASVAFLDYVAYTRDDGKPGYRTYRRLFAQRSSESAADTEQRLKAQFLKDVDGGYQNDYDTSILGQETAQVTSGEPVEKKDVLPF